MVSYISKKVEIEKSKNGKGIFAIKRIKKDKIVVDYSNGLGKFINSKEAEILYNKRYDHMIQVNNNIFFAATIKKEFEKADFINHSCNPNCGIKGSLKIIALRDIEPREEITFDYAMSESSNYRMKCKCGSKYCRKIITGNDWKLKSLQKKYKGFFSIYLQKKIRKLKSN